MRRRTRDLYLIRENRWSPPCRATPPVPGCYLARRVNIIRGYATREAAVPWWRRRSQMSDDRFPDYESERGRAAVARLFARPPVLIRIGSNSMPGVRRYHLLNTIEELDRVLASSDFGALLVEAHAVEDLQLRDANPDGRVCVLFNDSIDGDSDG